jgi:DNA invertase Pin-like site-specific DNA recombinase
MKKTTAPPRMTPPKDPTAFSYLRFSNPEQAKGDSVRRQTELRDGWLARNKVPLDESLTLRDKGVSAFNGLHREDPDKHALALFLKLVESGRVRRGDYLLIENLDRLSRENEVPACHLLTGILMAGVNVVQLSPYEMLLTEKSNGWELMRAVMELSRGHGESVMKSERVGKAWREKKRRAAEDKEPLTARAPSWLRLVDGRWQIIDSAGAAVRRVYRLATDGYGLGVITKKLNADKVPVIGRAGHWARSYVAKLLNNRSVVGEYQPFKGRAGQRQPDGKPIDGYYPVVITADEWYAARAAIAGRRNREGRPAKERVNVFSGLLHDARDGGTLQQMNKGKKGGGRSLVGYKATQGVDGSTYCSFPLLTFETEILKRLREIKVRDILPTKEDSVADNTAVLAGRLAEVDAEIEKVKARLQARYSDALADVVERHEAERKELAEQLTQAMQDTATPLDAAWKDARTLVDVLENAPDEEEARVRLRAALRRITTGIYCLFMARGRLRLAAVQIHFTGGQRRDYVILHKPATGGSVGERPARTWCKSLAAVVKPGDLDLRDPEQAKQLEATLTAVDLDTAAEGQDRPARRERPRRRR